ncbi:MAG: hypothetical protein ACN4E2_04980 [Nitrospinota bacterium]
MFRKELDKLLAISLKNQPDLPNSGDIEQKVWNKIHLLQRENNIPWHEKMLQAMSVWQFQVSSIALSIIFGLIIGIATSTQTYTASKAEMGLHAFSSNSSYLLSTKLVRNYEETLR